MALKDKFASSLAARTGLTPEKSAEVLGHVLEMICSKVPDSTAAGLRALMDSPNGVNPAAFQEYIEIKAKEAISQKLGSTPLGGGLAEAPKASWQEVAVETGVKLAFRRLSNKVRAFFGAK